MHIGVDLGRTKVAAICLDGQGNIQHEARIDTVQDYESCVASIATLITEIESSVGTPCTLGVGTPGALSASTGLLKNAGIFDGKAMDKDLSAALGRPVPIGNDANCFALSEAVDGAGTGAQIVFGVILGTGVGGGIVVDGQVLNGANAIAGEWGHTPLPWPKDEERPGPICFCGKSGCVETFLSGPGLSADHARHTGEQMTAKQICMTNTPNCRASMARYEHRLARALSGIINVLDPDVIVLGGGLSNIEQIYGNVPKLWTGFVTSDHIATKLRKAEYGDASGVRGAAWLGKNASPHR